MDSLHEEEERKMKDQAPQSQKMHPTSEFAVVEIKSWLYNIEY